MDLLQIALVFLILLLSVFLSILGIQVFFILKDLRRSLDKFDVILGDAQGIAEDIQKPVAVAAEVAQIVGVGANVVREIIAKKGEQKPSRRLFKKSK